MYPALSGCMMSSPLKIDHNKCKHRGDKTTNRENKHIVCFKVYAGLLLLHNECQSHCSTDKPCQYLITAFIDLAFL
jgi:hypothetical protein